MRGRTISEWNLMTTNELIDELIADGHKTVTLYGNRMYTDDEGETMEQFLLIGENGDVVARTLHAPGTDGWKVLTWYVAPSRCSALEDYGEIDLLNRDESAGWLSICNN